MLNINTLLIPIEDPETSPISETMVVVHADHSTDRVFIINYQGKAKKPTLFSLHTVVSWVDLEIIRTGILELPKFYNYPDSEHPEKALNSRNKRITAIQPIINQLEEFLMPGYGSKLVKTAAESAKVFRDQIYQWTYRYLQLGQMKNALLPKYYKLQSPHRKLSDVRLGRRPRSKNAPYKQKTKSDEIKLFKILKKYYLKKGGNSIRFCYEKFLEIYFSDSLTVLPDGRRRYEINADNHNYPSINQFRFWTKKLLAEKNINARRVRFGSSKYDKDLAGRSGDRIRANAPGEVYQIDATVGDIELLSQFDPMKELRVGRPTVYSVVDEFSEAIVAFYLTLAPPSWEGMRLALFNAFRSKKQLAAEFGLDIEDDDWPMSMICLSLLGDNAELTSAISEAHVEDLGITVKFGRPYRGDDKGLVEKSFDHYNQNLFAKLPGFVKKGSEKRGEKNPKIDALLTLPALNRQLIQYVLHHNNYAECDPNIRTKAMAADQVAPRRRDIWNWGVKNRPFAGKTLPEEHLYMNLLEKGQASINREGISFKQLSYQCDWVRENGLQDQKINQNRAQKVDIRYMRHSNDVIFICTPDGLKPAMLAAKSNRFSECSFDEVELQIEKEHNEKQRRANEELGSRLSLNASIESEIQSASKTARTLPKNEVNRQHTSDNREYDIIQQNTSERNRFHALASTAFSFDSDLPSALDVEEESTSNNSKRFSEHDDAMKQIFGDGSDHNN
jgi:hypothetical protein